MRFEDIFRASLISLLFLFLLLSSHKNVFGCDRYEKRGSFRVCITNDMNKERFEEIVKKMFWATEDSECPIFLEMTINTYKTRDCQHLANFTHKFCSKIYRKYSIDENSLNTYCEYLE